MLNATTNLEQRGQEYISDGNYEKAINQFLIALSCPDKPPSGDDLLKLIKQALEGWRGQQDEAERKINAYKKDKIDMEAWIQALQIGTIASFELYKGNFPHGRYVTPAEEKIEELEEEQTWQSAEDVRTVSGYQYYKLQYPSGKYAEEADWKIADLTVTLNGREYYTIRRNGLVWMAEKP